MYFLVKLKQMNCDNKASTVVMSLKSPVIMVTNVKDQGLRLGHSISVVKRANILKNNAPIRPGLLMQRKIEIFEISLGTSHFFTNIKICRCNYNVT